MTNCEGAPLPVTKAPYRVPFTNSRPFRAPDSWEQRRVSIPVARFTFFLAATYPFFIWSVGTFSPETLLVFLATLLLWLVDRWKETGDRRRVALAAVVAGLLVWVKPVFLPLPLFLLLTERIRGRNCAG